MGYIAKAYVKIPRESVQNLILELCRLDYKNSAYHPSDVFWFIEDGYLYSREYTTELEEDSFIDCNAHTPNSTEEEAVKLFLELAMMRNDDSSTEWVRLDQPKESAGENTWIDTSYHKDWSSSNELIEALCEGWLKSLTPLEVAEAFRDGRIKL